MRIVKALLEKIEKDPEAFCEKTSIAEIKYLIAKLAEAYYNKKPRVSDEVFDNLVDAAKAIKGQDISVPVGAPVPKAAKNKVKLPLWMGSMNKLKTSSEIENWLKRHDYAEPKSQFIISDKLDGCSALYVKIGDNVKLYSRGDGIVGQDISPLLNLVKGFKLKSLPHTLLVRGELLMTKADFEKHYSDKSNSRNLVSGLVNAKKPDISIASHTHFVAYTTYIDPKHVNKPSELSALAKMGFEIATASKATTKNIDVETLSDLLAKRREKCPYEIDGIVIAHDSVSDLETGENPKSAFAFKSMSQLESVETTVISVDWSVSKDNLLKPTVVFELVNISGVKIKKATGFNYEYILTNKIGPGARIVIVRSGGVIPFIVETTKAAAQPSLPPAGSYTVKNKDAVAIGKENDAFKLRQVEYFFETIEVPAFGPGIVKKIYDAGYDTVPAVIHMTVNEMAEIQGLANRAQQFVDAIKTRIVTVSQSQLMKASNTFGQGFGSKKLDLIVEEIPNFDSIKLTVEMLSSIKGISAILANKFIEGLMIYKKWLKETKLESLHSSKSAEAVPAAPKAAKKAAAVATSSKNKIVPTVAPAAAVSELRAIKKPAAAVPKTISNKFTGRVYVFTGFRDAELKEKIEENGGIVEDVFTKKITHLLINDKTKDTNAKVVKARESGITVEHCRIYKHT